MPRPTRLSPALVNPADAAAAAVLTGTCPDGTPFVVDVATAPPAAGNVLGGRAADAGTVLTVPAGRTWRGRLTLSASASSAVATAAAVQTATLTLAGAGSTPAAGVLLDLSLAIPVTLATATVGGSGSGTVDTELVIIATGVDAVLTLAKSAGMTTARATARGTLIA